MASRYFEAYKMTTKDDQGLFPYPVRNLKFFRHYREKHIYRYLTIYRKISIFLYINFNLASSS